MKLKHLVMGIALAAFAVSVSAAEGTQLTYWLCYKVTQRGWYYDTISAKPDKAPTKCWLIAPLLGDGKLNYNSKISGGITLVEQESKDSGFQTELPGFVLYSSYLSYGKKTITFGQGYNVQTTPTYEYQRIYSLYGIGTPARGVEPTDKTAVLYWSSRLTGSYSMLNSGGDIPSMAAGSWTCILDSKTSAAMTRSIDPTKTVSENYAIAMPIFVNTAKLKFNPATK